MLALKYRVIVATVYASGGGFLVLNFGFLPWWRGSWIYFAICLGWAIAGIRYDPFRFGVNSASRPVGRVGRFVERWPVLVLSTLILLPFIAWVTRFWWYFPWLPWWSAAPYWIVRELLVASSFAVCLRLVFLRLTLGRRLCILLAFLLTSHIVMLLAYHCIAGTKDYLRDGVTQDCFRMQLWFKLAVGIVVFIGLEVWTRKQVRRDTELSR